MERKQTKAQVDTKGKKSGLRYMDNTNKHRAHGKPKTAS